MKYIKPLQENKASYTKGAVILIKGKENKGKPSLFATHVIGSSEIKPGVTMLFLSDEFYRVSLDEKRIRTHKISYTDDSALRAALNIKSTGKISIVKNKNKTPFHWKTMKHSTIAAALKEIEDDLLDNDLLVENSGQESIDPIWNAAWNKIIKGVINTTVLGKRDLLIFTADFDKDEAIEDAIQLAEDDDERHFEVEWEANFMVIESSEETRAAIDKFDLNIPLEVTFLFNGLGYGNYENKYDYEYLSLESSTLIESFVEGSNGVPDDELIALLETFREKTKDFTIDVWKKLIDQNNSIPANIKRKKKS